MYAFGDARQFAAYQASPLDPVDAIFSNPKAQGYHLVTRSGATVSSGTASPAAPAITPAPVPTTSATGCTLTPGTFYASVDTMKESMDRDRFPLTPAQIANDVNLAASVHTTHITVDVHWDYPAYMREWVSAIRNAHRHVWFRIHPNAWEGNNGVAATLTPATYLTAENAFVSANAHMFKSGDILDMNPEPENGPYWQATYGSSWTRNPTAVADYNAFFVGVSDTAATALARAGVTGVNTKVRSTNSWFAEQPTALYPATVSHMGRVTIDSYPDQYDTTPAAAVLHRMQEIHLIESRRPKVPIVVAEFGYSNRMNVSDALQANVVKAELAAMSPDLCIRGLNYWVGAGTQNSGGFTHIFTGSTGKWQPRPAASQLAAYFSRQLLK